MLSPTVLVRGNPARTKFAVENSNIFIEENVFENVVCEMAAILPRGGGGGGGVD